MMNPVAIALVLLILLVLCLIGWGFWHVISFLAAVMEAVDEDQL